MIRSAGSLCAQFNSADNNQIWVVVGTISIQSAQSPLTTESEIFRRNTDGTLEKVTP